MSQTLCLRQNGQTHFKNLAAFAARFLKIFGRKNQLPGFQISRTLVENELTLHNIIYLMNKIIWHHLSQYLGLPYYEEGD